jgi:dipeptidyl-peptidase-3
MRKYIYSSLIFAIMLNACNTTPTHPVTSAAPVKTDTVPFNPNEFADLQLLRYEINGFDGLSLKQKQLAYYLYQAALSGRDIIYDQKDKNGLLIRKTLENIYTTYKGDKTTADWNNFQEYCGRFWFSNGNHHHYSNDKFIPKCSYDYFIELMAKSDANGFDMAGFNSISGLLAYLKPSIFDITFEPKLVDLTKGIDNINASSVNFYEGVTQSEVEDYYKKLDTKGHAPSWGLNSKTVKENGKVTEKLWKVGGMYSASIEKIVMWLGKAVTVAENAKQKDALEKLIKFYTSGDVKDFDEYCIAWVKDLDSKIDVVNGFIEVYMDPIGKKGSYESIVSIKDEVATKTIKAIADNAQWFEDHSPLLPQHKKKHVKGISAKAITVVVESGDGAPSTPIGINLPNADWIRSTHGSKSVSLTNIVHSYNEANAKKGAYAEFAFSQEYIDLNIKYGNLAGDLHTDMHECIGHASGQIEPGVETTDKTLKNYASCLEEARADLVGLYFIMDKKLMDIGVMPSMDVAKCEYNNYITSGLITQLTRIELGKNLEEAHMRNRQLVAQWAYEHGKKDNVIEWVKRDGKTYVKINDYEKLHVLFGDLLREIQRIKSQGDYKAATDLVEGYGVKVDQALLKEVKDRYSKMGLKPYKGFIQPRLVAVMEGDKITDVKVEYPENFFDQMIEYGKNYAFLPVKN